MRLYLIILFALMNVFSCSHEDNSVMLFNRVQRIRLDNGLTFLVLPKDRSLAFSSTTMIRAGGIEEGDDENGLAHLYEHLVLQGTTSMSDHDPQIEENLRKQVLDVGTRWLEAKKSHAPQSEVLDLEKQLHDLEEEHSKTFVDREFVKIMNDNGGKDVGANILPDYAIYSTTLPKEKFELWAFLESERLKHGPQFRNYFKELKMIEEERFSRLEGMPDAILLEEFLQSAFEKSPYRNHHLGQLSDLHNLTPQKIREFFEKYYRPDRMVIVLVGGVDSKHIRPTLEKYFGDISSKPSEYTKMPQELHHSQLPISKVIKTHFAERFMIGYAHESITTSIAHMAAFDLLAEYLCSTQHAVLYDDLFLEKKWVSSMSCHPSNPGMRLPSYFTIRGTITKEITNQKVIEHIQKTLEKLMHEGFDDQLIEQAKTKIKADMIFSLRNDDEVADRLAHLTSLFGDWKVFFDYENEIQSLDSKHLQNILKTYFIPQNRVTVTMENDEADTHE